METGASLVFFVILTVVGIPVLCITLVILAVVLRSGNSAKKRGKLAEETRLIQEMHQQLGKLETRIESLETIVLEPERGKEPST